MKKRTILISALSLICFLACSTKKNTPTPITGEAAPDFSAVGIDGNNYSLNNYRGKVVVLFFLGNNCPSCKAVASSIESNFVSDYPNGNVQVLGLDQWNGNKASLESFQSTTKVSFPLLLSASSIASSYATTYDRLIVIDRNGFIRFRGMQIATNDINEAKKVVNEYLSK